MRTCIECGAPFDGHSSRITCGTECSVARRRRQNRENPRTAYAPRSPISFQCCEFCGCLWTCRRGAAARACHSEACQKALRNAAMRAWFQRYREEQGHGYARGRYDDAATAHAARRRAVFRGVQAESFTRVEIGNRDEWVCWLCDVGVDRELRFPDPGSASIDHVVPISLGGPHTRGNVRLAHLGCNAARGNRLAAVA